MDIGVNDFVDDLNLRVAQGEYKNWKVFDRDNPEFYITEIYYDSEKDKLFFKTEEEEIW